MAGSGAWCQKPGGQKNNVLNGIVFGVRPVGAKSNIRPCEGQSVNPTGSDTLVGETDGAGLGFLLLDTPTTGITPHDHE
jgi:hypothetical protein